MRTLAIATALALCIVSAGRAAQTAPSPTILTPDKIHWQAGTGAMKGAQFAVLYGDPSRPGFYAMRLRMPDGLVFAPHVHGEQENVSVISGTLMVGLGDKVDTTKMVSLAAGSFVSVPPHVHHYAMSKGTTVLEIAGIGPRTMTAVH
jgi:mannose-6-phosphate isomerase-like protein (cupin superfamily)